MQIMQNAEHFVISTHVSARETNNIYKYIKGWKCDFNSRLRKETNHTGVLQTNMGCHFNSRLRKETNNERWSDPGKFRNFNSRLRKETNFGRQLRLQILEPFQLTSP